MEFARGTTCTLRQAIIAAAAGDTINFAAGLTTITLTSAELLINKDLTINGPGANLLTVRRSDAAGNFRIFEIASPNVTISGLTIANGNAPSPASGGGIYNDDGSNLTVTGCAISRNFAGGFGGGIRNGGNTGSGAGTVTITNSTISGNNGGNGGGGVYNQGTVTITNSTLSGNSASASGNSSKRARFAQIGPLAWSGWLAKWANGIPTTAT